MFHHTKIVQGKPPKPRLRLHVREHTGVGEWARFQWKVEHISADGVHAYDRTTWWHTPRLALDAAYFQFACEWPAGR